MKIDRDAFGKFFNGTPGKEWDDYASRLRNAAAGEVDERGYSLADEFDGVAEGGPLGPQDSGATKEKGTRSLYLSSPSSKSSHLLWRRRHDPSA